MPPKYATEVRHPAPIYLLISKPSAIKVVSSRLLNYHLEWAHFAEVVVTSRAVNINSDNTFLPDHLLISTPTIVIGHLRKGKKGGMPGFDL